jgi:hypothetical protein
LVCHEWRRGRWRLACRYGGQCSETYPSNTLSDKVFAIHVCAPIAARPSYRNVDESVSEIVSPSAFALKDGRAGKLTT